MEWSYKHRSWKKYLEIKNSQRHFYFLYFKLATVQVWEQSNKFPLTCSSCKCLLLVKKFFRENSAGKLYLLCKQTPPTNTAGSLITEPISAWKLPFVFAHNLQSTLVFRIALKGERIFSLLVFFLKAVGAKWGRQQRERPLESKLKRLGGKNKLVKENAAASNEPLNFREGMINFREGFQKSGMFHFLPW